jgi:hypothetical protein
MTLEENKTEEIASGANDAGVTTAEVTPPRRRGRPPGSGKKTAEGETPNTVPGDEKPQGAKRGPKPRGRKFSGEDIGALAKQIQGLHALGAMVTGIPELQIAEQEAHALAGGVVAVAKEYNLEISGKTGALIQLAAACAAVYIPRVLIIKQRAAQAQAQARASQGVTIEGEVTAS